MYYLMNKYTYFLYKIFYEKSSKIKISQLNLKNNLKITYKEFENSLKFWDLIYQISS